MILKWYIGCIIIAACLLPSFLNGSVAYGTRFAIVKEADITPPDAPSNIRIVRRSNTSVAISLTPPTKDYHHTAIYRSTSPDVGHEDLIEEIKVGEQFEYVDIGLREGEEYYYAIATVDEAGNKSHHLKYHITSVVGSSGEQIFSKNVDERAKTDFESANLDVPFVSQHGWKGYLGNMPVMGSIDRYGCALACTTMVFNYYGIKTDPEKLNAWLSNTEHFGYEQDGAIRWHVAMKYTTGIIYNFNMGNGLMELETALSKGFPVIAWVVSASVPMHFIVFTKKVGDKYYFLDPWDVNYPVIL